VVLVDVPGFKVETHGAEGLVVILDEEALSRKAGIPLPASSGGGSHMAGSKKSHSSSDAWQEQGNGTAVGHQAQTQEEPEEEEEAPEWGFAEPVKRAAAPAPGKRLDSSLLAAQVRCVGIYPLGNGSLYLVSLSGDALVRFVA
jgi:hypothetical protein